MLGVAKTMRLFVRSTRHVSTELKRAHEEKFRIEGCQHLGQVLAKQCGICFRKLIVEVKGYS